MSPFKKIRAFSIAVITGIETESNPGAKNDNPLHTVPDRLIAQLAYTSTAAPMFSMMQSANWLVFTLVAPSISRSKS